MYRMTALALLAALALTACSDDEECPPDTTLGQNGECNPISDPPPSDTGVDAARDAAPDAAADIGQDIGRDVAPDVAADASPDVAPDTGADAAVDASPDVAPDVAPDAAPAVEGDTCETAIDATAGGTFADQSTSDAADDYDSPLSAINCPSGSASGPDEVYVLSPATTTAYEARVEPVGNFDPFLYVRADCADETCMAGTVFNGPGQAETLTFEVPGGQSAFLIVDGELGSSGNYSLTVTLQ